MTKSKASKRVKEDELYSSKNHSKDVKYRIRIQEELEAEKEIKDYEHQPVSDQIPSSSETTPGRPL